MQVQKINNIVAYKGNNKTQDTNDKPKFKKSDIAPAAGALLGAVGSVALISKATRGKFTFSVFENDSLLKDLGAILAVSSSAIFGGLLGGLTQAKTMEDKKAKVKESLFDIATVAIPSVIATSVLGAAKKMNIKNVAPKIIAPIAGIGLGMPMAQKLSGVIDAVVHKDDPNFEPKERKLKLQDYVVHIDDILAIMIISKIPFANKLHADKILPLIYAWCGFEAGSKTAEKTDVN